MDTGHDGRTVQHGGSFYHFRTIEQAAGFFRAIQEGKSVESCRQRWRPSMVRVSVGTATCTAERPKKK
jgi:urease beta subunit